MKIFNIKKLTLALILITIFLLYIIFLYLDLHSTFNDNTSDKLKYISILLCFILSLLTQEASLSFKDTLLLQLGLLFTSLADLFFLIFDFCTIGVATFCLVQILYCIRYQPKKAYSTIVGFVIFIVATAIGFLILSIFTKDIQPLYMVALIYAICIITSLLRALKACKEKAFPSPNRYMLVVGMLLFMLCDINVFLRYLSSSVRYPCLFLNKYEATYGFLVLLFYLPSQVLLGLSGYDFSKLFSKNV